MDTNTRGGGRRRQNIDTNKPADKEDLRLTPAEYFELSYLQKSKDLQSVAMVMNQKDIEIYGLRRRIVELEALILNNKASQLKQREKDAEQDLVQCRTKIAERIGLPSISEYIVDTNTLLLKHESEV